MKKVYSLLIIFLSYFLYSQTEITIEAESGVLNGTQISTIRSGYSGSGYITGFDQNSDYVEVTTQIPSSGIWEIKIRYAAPYGYKENYLYINGQLQATVSFPETTSFSVVSAGKMFLSQGEVKIKVQSYWGWFELDSFILLKADISSFNIQKNLTTPDAIPQAKRLISFLVDSYGKNIISGQWSSHTGSNTELDYISSVTNGKQPAIWGLDMLYYSGSAPLEWRNNVSQKAIDWWKNKKGIVTMCWHWFSPKDWTDQIWNSFYSDKTNFDVRRAVQEGTEEYNLIIRDIDIIANEFKQLQNEGVPILWRPLHEASGGWFWWGKYGAQPCKQLYRIMYDRMVNYHGLKNLIWVWTVTKTTQDELDWYPGDDVVDIIGYDIYNQAGDYSPVTMAFYNISGMFGNKKIVTLSENGPIPDPDLLKEQQAYWSWFCPWAGEYIMDGIKNTTEHINKVYYHNYVITLDELPDLETYPYDETQSTQTITYYNLFIQITPQNSGSITKFPNKTTFIKNSTVTLTAIANQNYVFSHWSGDILSTSNPITITITTNTTIIANFVENLSGTKTYTIDLSVNPEGAGIVYFNPQGPTYLENTQITLTAQPNNGYIFSNWSGDIQSSSNSVVVIMDSNKQITANFTAINNSDLPPVIDSINLYNNAVLTSDYLVLVNCSDDVGIQKVEFYIDGVLVFTSTSSPYFYTIKVNSLTKTQHSLVVVVYDDKSQTSYSQINFHISSNNLVKNYYLSLNNDGVNEDISFDSGIFEQIFIYNTKGNLVNEWSNGNYKKDIKDFRPGVYIYKAKLKSGNLKTGTICIIK